MFLSISIIFIIIAVLYAFVIIYFTIGWNRLNEGKTDKNVLAKFSISIIIPFYNESENLPNLLKDLLALEYPKSNYEIILVDNNSTDNSVEIINAFIEKNNIKIKSLKSDGSKKQAVWKGINSSKCDYILSLDADCRIPLNILKNYDSQLQSYPYKFISGPVVFTSDNSLFGKFTELEFLSLVSSGAGAIGVNIPIMANAANMLFEKSVAISAEHIYKSKEQSGDDVFLLEYIVQKYGAKEVQFLKSKETIVSTPAPKTIKAWINQRLRWTAKAKNYSISAMSLTALIILTYSLLQFILLPMAIISLDYLYLWIIAVALKTFIDFSILYKSAKFFRKQSLVKYILLFEIVYPIYIVGVSFGALLYRGSWKGR